MPVGVRQDEAFRRASASLHRFGEWSADYELIDRECSTVNVAPRHAPSLLGRKSSRHAAGTRRRSVARPRQSPPWLAMWFPERCAPKPGVPVEVGGGAASAAPGSASAPDRGNLQNSVDQCVRQNRLRQVGLKPRGQCTFPVRAPAVRRPRDCRDGSAVLGRKRPDRRDQVVAVLVVIAIGSVVATGAVLRAAAPEPGLGVAGQLQDVLAARWRDGEIRAEKISGTAETEISLGLLPVGPYGTLTVVLTARVQQGPVAEPPGSLQVLMGAGLNVNPNAIRRPILRFVLDPQGPRTTTLDASDRLRILDLDPSASLDNASATITLVEFIQILRADVITGQVLGLDVSFTPKQRDALQAFGMRVLRPAAR